MKLGKRIDNSSDIFNIVKTYRSTPMFLNDLQITGSILAEVMSHVNTVRDTLWFITPLRNNTQVL